ncbi:hypothetical protein [Hydrogenophaga sp. RWCD_12]|uniref:hypothetical protein n=1 Tax=Hydrogenophaga sp. RWCD_12 TaxID=3391190 RepID=UPI003984C233
MLKAVQPEPSRFALSYAANTEGTTPLAFLPQMLSKTWAKHARRLLDNTMLEHVQRIESRIPREAITGMRRNYREKLPKSLRIQTVYFDSPRTAAYRAASKIGLLQMLRSESLAQFAERITGLSLDRRRGIQLILYQPGDYSGPHNDHHPENAHAKDGFIDLHISLCNEGVQDQFLVCEENGHLAGVYPAASDGSVAVYRLPFWHYTTPLRAKPGAEKDARRWLLLATFDLSQPAGQKS